MPSATVNDTVQLELFQQLHGQKIENVTYWRLDGGWGFAEATDLWNSVLIWWTTVFSDQLSADLSLRGGKITDLSSETGFVLEFNAPSPNPVGGFLGAALPGNVALCVSLRTALRGRSYRGRNFVAGLAEASVSGNTVEPVNVGYIQAAYEALRTIAGGYPYELVVVSRYHNGVKRDPAIATTVTSCAVRDPYVDSQRRRLTGRGQ